MVYSSTVTSKGTITLPADVRKTLGIAPGQQVDIEFIEANNKIVISVPLTIDEVRRRNQAHLKKMGMVYKPGQMHDTNELWAQAAVERYGRSLSGDA